MQTHSAVERYGLGRRHDDPGHHIHGLVWVGIAGEVVSLGAMELGGLIAIQGAQHLVHWQTPHTAAMEQRLGTHNITADFLQFLEVPPFPPLRGEYHCQATPFPQCLGVQGSIPFSLRLLQDSGFNSRGAGRPVLKFTSSS